MNPNRVPMCVTRVARILSIEDGRATVRYLDSAETAEVDTTMVDARKGSYLEIFAGTAIGCITKKEAEFKRALRLEVLSRTMGTPG